MGEVDAGDAAIVNPVTRKSRDTTPSARRAN